MDIETFKLLQQAGWDTIGKKLLAFTVWRAQNYRWRRGDGFELVVGKTCEDIVQEVILKTLNGDRHWDPNKGELLPWLKDQIKSELDHFAKSTAHRYEKPIPQDENQEDDTGMLDCLAQIHNSINTSISEPEQAIVDTEDRAGIKQQVNALFEIVDGVPELEQILEAVIDGCEPKPRELADWLSISVQEVNNRLKRIRRQARKGK
ncbi:MAG TPA: hypothetical protein PKZ84_06630 [Anaerolineae bacterium]|nr:hypothetical protein [Anaerolineae bacterium]HQI83362.1 hypothetical protein [Anaerolineae bacterium]